MKQDDEPAFIRTEAANVHQVPNFSPLRYPGGKTWAIPLIREFLGTDTTTLLEPFAGGATASLVAILEGRAGHATLAETDPGIAALWRTILDDPNELIEGIRNHDPEHPDAVEPGTALATLVANRTRWGGILAGHAGVRTKPSWPAHTLEARVRKIHRARSRIDLFEGDGLSLLEPGRTTAPGTRVFADPPYEDVDQERRRLAPRLYRRHETKLETVVERLAETGANALITCADTAHSRELGERAGFNVARIEMRGNLGEPRTELVLTTHDTIAIRPANRGLDL